MHNESEEANIKRKVKKCFFYRLINNNVYTKSKMVKFKMTDSAECERCGAEETSKHLLWDCLSHN